MGAAPVSAVRGAQFLEAALEELAHGVSGAPDGRVVLVERAAVVEDDTSVSSEVLVSLVPAKMRSTKWQKLRRIESYNWSRSQRTSDGHSRREDLCTLFKEALFKLLFIRKPKSRRKHPFPQIGSREVCLLFVLELGAHGLEVHRVLDDLAVGGELLHVDGEQEGPGLVVLLQLAHQLPGNQDPFSMWSKTVANLTILSPWWQQNSKRSFVLQSKLFYQKHK